MKHLLHNLQIRIVVALALIVATLGLATTPAHACGATIEFDVIRPNGQSITLDMESSDEVAVIKLRIEDKTDIPPAQQRLFMGGSALDDSQTLHDYGITCGSTLNLVITQDASALDVTTAPGSAFNSTSLTVSGVASGDTLYIKPSNVVIDPPYVYGPIDPTADGLSAYVNGSDIPNINLSADKYIAVYELDSSNRTIGFKLVTLSLGDVKTQNFVTLPNATDSNLIRITTPQGTTITCSSAQKQSTQHTDAGYNYPLGLVHYCFDTSSSSNTVTLVFVTNLEPSQVVARKFNSTTGKYANIAGAIISKTQLGGKAALSLTYNIVDNGPLDQNPATGSITDPVGLAVATTPSTLANTGGKLTPIMAIYLGLALVISSTALMLSIKQQTTKQ